MTFKDKEPLKAKFITKWATKEQLQKSLEMQFIIDRNKPLPFNLNMTMIHDLILIILRLSNQLLLKSNQIRCVNLENWEATRGKQVHFDLRATFNLVLDFK